MVFSGAGRGSDLYEVIWLKSGSERIEKHLGSVDGNRNLACLERGSGSLANYAAYRNAMVLTPEISKRLRQRRFLQATLSSRRTM